MLTKKITKIRVFGEKKQKFVLNNVFVMNKNGYIFFNILFMLVYT